MRYLVLSFAIIVAAPFARAEETAVRSYPLPEHGTFQVKVPESWKDSVAQSGGGLPSTITFAPKAGAPFKILVTPLWSARPDLKTPTADEIKAKMRLAADEVARWP